MCKYVLRCLTFILSFIKGSINCSLLLAADSLPFTYPLAEDDARTQSEEIKSVNRQGTSIVAAHDEREVRYMAKLKEALSKGSAFAETVMASKRMEGSLEEGKVRNMRTYLI